MGLTIKTAVCECGHDLWLGMTDAAESDLDEAVVICGWCKRGWLQDGSRATPEQIERWQAMRDAEDVRQEKLSNARFEMTGGLYQDIEAGILKAINEHIQANQPKDGRVVDTLDAEDIEDVMEKLDDLIESVIEHTFDPNSVE